MYKRSLSVISERERERERLAERDRDREREREKDRQRQREREKINKGGACEIVQGGRVTFIGQEAQQKCHTLRTRAPRARARPSPGLLIARPPAPRTRHEPRRAAPAGAAGDEGRETRGVSEFI